MTKAILVVDGDLEHRKAVRRLVEPLGVGVEEADGPADLVARARATRPALVLLDLDRDPEAAFDAVDTLKDDPATAEIQVLAMASQPDAGRTAGATEHGFEDFLGKPVQERELVPILRFHLDLPHGLNDAHPT